MIYQLTINLEIIMDFKLQEEKWVIYLYIDWEKLNGSFNELTWYSFSPCLITWVGQKLSFLFLSNSA